MDRCKDERSGEGNRLMKEVWVDLCDEEGNHGEFYQISSLGRVRSLDRKVLTKGAYYATRRGKVLSQCRHASGYLVIGLAINGRNKQRMVSRLVAFSFYGPPAEPDMEAAHGDGVRSNNCKSNIRWATKLENAADKKLHGTDNRGATNPRATLSDGDVDHVLLLSSCGLGQHEIAKMVGSNAVTINHILTGRTWGHHTGIQYESRHATITQQMVRRMRTLKSLGMTLQDIADTLGVSKAATFRHTAPAVMGTTA